MEQYSQDSRRQALYDWACAWLQQHTAFRPQRLDVVSGDASFRRYFRLVHSGGTLIAVDAPPAKENSRPFVAIARALYDHEVRVPQVIQADFELGFMLLSDFGDTMLRPCLTDDSVDGWYQQAMAELVHIQNCPPPADYALPPYDSTRLLTEMALFKDWFVSQYLGLSLSAQEQALIDHTCRQIAEAIGQQPVVFVHRDYHSRNLMVLADGGIGVIDFQDAVTGPVTYDLVSLLRDAYVEWPNERVIGWVEDFRTMLQDADQLSNAVSPHQFVEWFDWMGAQRHLKVLGIFARLSLRDGKHGYLNDIPLVFKYLLNEIKAYPALQPFGDWLRQRIVPAYITKKPDAAAMLEATQP